MRPPTVQLTSLPHWLSSSAHSHMHHVLPPSIRIYHRAPCRHKVMPFSQKFATRGDFHSCHQTRWHAGSPISQVSSGAACLMARLLSDITSTSKLLCNRIVRFFLCSTHFLRHIICSTGSIFEAHVNLLYSATPDMVHHGYQASAYGRSFIQALGTRVRPPSLLNIQFQLRQLTLQPVGIHNSYR